MLARQGDLVLLIHPAGGPFTDRLLGLLADSARAGQDGLRFTELVSAEFDADAAAAGDRPGPAVVAFGPVGGGTAVAVYGTGWAEVTTAYGAQRLTTGEPYGRLRSVLPSALTMVSAGVQPVAPGSETDPYLRLADGVVRAVALVYAPAEIESDAAGSGRPAVTDHDGVPGAVAGLAVSGQQAAGPAAQEAVREEIPQATPAPPPPPEPEPEVVQPAESEYWATQIEPVASAPYAPEVRGRPGPVRAGGPAGSVRGRGPAGPRRAGRRGARPRPGAARRRTPGRSRPGRCAVRDGRGRLLQERALQ